MPNIFNFGGGGVSSSDVTASKAQVLTGYTALTKDSGDEPATGTMPNIGNKNYTGNSNVLIDPGYHSGGQAKLGDAYNAGHDQGVTDADNRTNVDSANYQAGYNKGNDVAKQNILSILGFVNAPYGKWVIKSGSMTLNEKNPNIIPICVRVSNGGGSLGQQSGGQGWYNAYNNYGMHVEALMVNGGDGKQYGGARGSSDNLFLPYLQGMDLTKVQNTYTSGTFTVWMVKQ